MKVLRHLARSVLAAPVCAACACASLPPASEEQSTAVEPPRSWDAAVFFVFADSSWVPAADYKTTIEFHDGRQQRTAAAEDLFDSPTGETRTPWYRLRPGPNGFDAVVRITLAHANGARTVAEYPLTIHRDEFVTVIARVYNRDPKEWYISMPLHRKSFPLDPAARAQPGDSLWVEHAGRNRDCFTCPR